MNPTLHPRSTSGAAPEPGIPQVPQAADLMSPLHPTVPAHHPLREAADHIAQSDEAFTVVVHRREVVGILTAEDVLTAVRADPAGWQGQPCATMMTLPQTRIPAHAAVTEVLRQYREHGVRPLVVEEEGTPLGVLRPHEVRRWGQEHGYLPEEAPTTEDPSPGQHRSEGGAR